VSIKTVTAKSKSIVVAALLMALPVLPGFAPFSLSGVAIARDGEKAVKEKIIESVPPIWHWKSQDEKPKAVVLCLHELGMHGGVFNDLGTRLSQKGMAVYAMDLRGFGGWRIFSKKAGKMNIPASLKDIKQVATALKSKYPDTKLFVLGEAMGGALALEAQARYGDLIDGTISSCPGGEHFGTFRNYTTVGGHFLTSPNKDFGMAKQLIDAASPRSSTREFLKSDPDVRLDLTATELMSCQFYMYKTRRFARAIKEDPVLIVQGMKDGESKPAGTERVFKSLSTKDKKFMQVADGDHYVFEDKTVNDKAFSDTVSWLDDHIKPQS